jgi:DNA-binding MarR family transcriptional regulator
MTRARTAVQEELRQRRPFASPAEEAAVALMRTTDLLGRALVAVVEPHGMTLQQYNVLRILRGAGTEGLPTLEIASRMIEHAPGVTRLLDRLQAKGLVRRQRAQGDRRQIRCWIEPAGLALLGPLDGAMHDAARRFMGALTAPELARFIEDLDALRAGAPEGDVTSTETVTVAGPAAPPLRKQGERR